MSIETEISNKLHDAFSPEFLEVVDETPSHRGHSETDGASETHFRIRIVSKSFSGMSKMSRHRAVNNILQLYFNEGMHALSIDASAPEDAPAG